MTNKFVILLILVSVMFSFNVVKTKASQNPKVQSISFLDLGGVGDGVTDNSIALTKAIEYCIKNNKTLYIPKTSSFYLLNSTVRVGLSSGQKVSIKSNQATIKSTTKDFKSAYRLSSYREHIFLSIGRSFKSISSFDSPEQLTGTSISLNGLIFDGGDIQVNENLTSYNSDIYVGAQLVAENIDLVNCSFKNILGFGARFHEATRVNIKRCNFNNVGGRGFTPFANKVDYDAFGDALYFAKLNVNAIINIENSNLYGKKKGNKRSRCGMTFEFNKYKYTSNLKNVNISGYAKGVHLEEKTASVFNFNKVLFNDFNFAIANTLNDLCIINLKNCVVNTGINDGNDFGEALAFLNYRSKAQIFVDKSVLNFNGRKYAYQSVVGLAKVTNSTINAFNTNFYFADGNTVFDNCRFINFGGDHKSFFSNNPNFKFKVSNSIFIGVNELKIKNSNVKLDMINNRFIARN